MIDKIAYRKLLRRPEWQARRLQIITRDGNKCTKCGNVENLHVHHLKYSSDVTWNSPDTELITLCKGCHNNAHGKTNDPDETFACHRNTNGVDWIFKFTGIELHMLVVLLEIETLNTGMVNLTPLVKKHLANKFEKSSRYIREVIASLESKDALVRVTGQDIVLNPSYFYKGGTKTFKNKMLMYSNFKESKNKQKQ